MNSSNYPGYDSTPIQVTEDFNMLGNIMSIVKSCPFGSTYSTTLSCCKGDTTGLCQ